MHVQARKRKGKGLDPATVKARKSMASGFFGNLVKLRDLSANPFATVETPKLKKRVLHNLMTFAEAEAIIAALPTAGWYGPRLRMLLGLGLHTGARLDEIVKANWGDINWADELITLDGKGDKERNVSLTPWLVAELAAYKAAWAGGSKGFAQAPIFIGRKGHRLAHKAVYAAIEKFALRSTYGLHPHLLRHIFGTKLGRSTRLQDIKEVMGHASVATSEQYIHASAQDTKAAIARVAAASTLGVRPPAPAAAPVTYITSTSAPVASTVHCRLIGPLRAAA
jgi:integrase/recombinase XerC